MAEAANMLYSFSLSLCSNHSHHNVSLAKACLLMEERLQQVSTTGSFPRTFLPLHGLFLGSVPIYAVMDSEIDLVH